MKYTSENLFDLKSAQSENKENNEIVLGWNDIGKKKSLEWVYPWCGPYNEKITEDRLSFARFGKMSIMFSLFRST